MGSEVLEYKTNHMGKYYENLDDLIGLIKKIDKKNMLAEFILDCIIIARATPELTPHEIIKKAKEKRK